MGNTHTHAHEDRSTNTCRQDRCGTGYDKVYSPMTVPSRPGTDAHDAQLARAWRMYEGRRSLDHTDPGAKGRTPKERTQRSVDQC